MAGRTGMIVQWWTLEAQLNPQLHGIPMADSQVPSECIGYVTGARRAALGNMEEDVKSWLSFLAIGL